MPNLEERAPVGSELPDGTWTPAPTTPTEEAMSDEDIEKALRDGSEAMRKEAIRKKVEAEPEPEPPKTEPAAAEAGGGETVEEKPAAPSLEDRLAELEARAELDALHRKKAEADLARSNFERDRLAGELGFVKKQLTTRRQAPVPAQQEDTYGTFAEAIERSAGQDERLTRLDQELHEMRQERTKRAVEREDESWKERNSAWFQGLNERIGEDKASAVYQRYQQRLAARAQEMADVLTGEDPKLAAVTARSLLDGTLAEVQIELFEEGRKQAAERLREQKEALRKQKLEAAVTGSTAAPTKVPTRAKTVDEMSDAELERAVQQSMRDHFR